MTEEEGERHRHASVPLPFRGSRRDLELRAQGRAPEDGARSGSTQATQGGARGKRTSGRREMDPRATGAADFRHAWKGEQGPRYVQLPRRGATPEGSEPERGAGESHQGQGSRAPRSQPDGAPHRDVAHEGRARARGD
eukprot:8393892-Pyramimonas_sp.AAC.1